MRLAVYSLLRLGLFAVCLGVLYLVGMRSFLLVVVAALVAWGLSYVLLGRWRDAAASQLAEAAERRKALGGKAELTGKAREQADLEDAADEAARASTVPDSAPAPVPDTAIGGGGDTAPGGDADTAPGGVPDTATAGVRDAAPAAGGASAATPTPGAPGAAVPEPGAEPTTRSNGTAARAPGDEL